MSTLAFLCMLLSACAARPPVVDTSVALKDYPRGARFAFFSPDDSHLLVTLCFQDRCRPWRYYFEGERWERVRLDGFDESWNFDSANYSRDGQRIALSGMKCTGQYPQVHCPYLESRLYIADARSGMVQALAGTQSSFYPTFDLQGEELFYWGLQNITPARSGRALYASHHVYSRGLDPSTLKLRFEYVAQLPRAPIRLSNDGTQLSIAAQSITKKIYSGISGADDDEKTQSVNSMVVADILKEDSRALWPSRWGASSYTFDFDHVTNKVLGVPGGFTIFLCSLDQPANCETFEDTLPHTGARVEHASLSRDAKRVLFVKYFNLFVGTIGPSRSYHQIATPLGLSN